MDHFEIKFLFRRFPSLFCLLFDSQLPVDSDLDVELAHVGSPPKRPFGLVTGSISGMGFNPVPTFDWNVITGIIEPILIPFHSALNQYLGMFLSGLVTLAVYDCNSKWTRWIPINDNSLFDNTGRPFDVKRILTNYQFDDTKYRQYSPPYFSAASLVLYGANFALYPMAFVYSILCHWREMGTAIGETWDTFRPPHRSNYEGLDDPFCRIQKKHPEVPDWWGITPFCSSILTSQSLWLNTGPQTRRYGSFFCAWACAARFYCSFASSTPCLESC